VIVWDIMAPFTGPEIFGELTGFEFFAPDLFAVSED